MTTKNNKKIKITINELRSMVATAVQTVLQEKSDFSAQRVIKHASAEACMKFEQEIIKALDLIHPDEFNNPKLEERYLFIVEQMKNEVEQAVSKAVRQLIAFPRNGSRAQHQRNNNGQR